MLLLAIPSLILMLSTQMMLDVGAFSSAQLHEDSASFQAQLRMATILIFSFSGHSQQTLCDILKSEMPYLQQLTFRKHHFDKFSPSLGNLRGEHTQFVSRKMIESIMKSSYFLQLRELHLIGVNLDDRSFSFLHKNAEIKGRVAKMEVLKLGSNFIGDEGFGYLSEVSLPSLKKLDVSNNLLASDMAVSSLIVILCGREQPEESCQCHLQSLDISSTGISIDGFVRVMKVIDPSTLKHLNISNNNLHLGKKHSQTSNLTAYRLLASLNFDQLQELQMNDMSLDSRVLTLFSRWRLPKVKTLGLFMNFIDDKSLDLWLTRQNFPRLKQLILYNNLLGDQIVEHLAEEQFELTDLNLGFNRISHMGLLAMTRREMKLLEKVYLKGIKIQSVFLKEFVENDGVGQIKELGFSGNSEIGDLFDYFPWHKMQNLQKLILTDCNLKDSIEQLISQKKVLAPKLSILLLNNTGLTRSHIHKLVEKSAVLFPDLQYLDLIQEHTQPLNFSELSRNGINEQLIVDLGYVKFQKLEGKLKIISLLSVGNLALFSASKDLTDFFEAPQQLAITLTNKINKTLEMTEDFEETISLELCSRVDFSALQTLAISKIYEFELFQAIVKHCQIKSFLFLQSLAISIPKSGFSLLQLLGGVDLPRLRDFKAIIRMDQRQNDLFGLFFYLKSKRALTNLMLRFKYEKIEKKTYNFNRYLNELSLPFLQGLDLSEGQLYPEQISAILHNNAPSLRYLNVNNNFLQKSFIKLLSLKKLRLIYLDLSFISFSKQEFEGLSKMDFSFLKTLNLESCDLTTEHILKLLQGGKDKVAFHKLSWLNLNDNDVRQNGTLALFDSGLFQLTFFRIKRNHNPNFINILLSYCTKLLQISAIGTDVYSLSQSIQPFSSRGIRVLAISTDQFEEEDFEILGRLEYQKLMFSQIYAREVYGCSFNKNLLRINRFVSKAVLFIKNQAGGLNSNCIGEDPEFQGYTSQVEELIIMDHHGTTFAPEFVQNLLRGDRNMKNLMLFQTRLPPSVFLSISPSRMRHVEIVNLARNYMDDEAFAWLISTPLSSMKFLDVSDNQITTESFGKLRGVTWPEVEEINLSGLPLGDEGVQVISTMKMPKLKRLFLMSCSIQNLSSFDMFRFPQLETLGLQRNNFKSEDLIAYMQSFPRQESFALENLSVKGMSLSLMEYKRIQQICKELKLRVELDEPYHILVQNSANY